MGGLSPRDAAFPVKGYAISSQLHAVSACQSIIKKAMVERLKAAYGLEQFPETGVKYQVRFSIFKDEAAIVWTPPVRDCTSGATGPWAWRRRCGRRWRRDRLPQPLPGRDPFCDPVLRQRHHSHRGGAHRQEPRPSNT